MGGVVDKIKPPTEKEFLHRCHIQRDRLHDILGTRYVRPTDKELSDRDFLREVFKRVIQQFNQPLLDPNE